ncbi:MAG: zinc-dependent metalloprotease [bacterium]|nr:zinc-dependent metalloprotease [bacterium]
MIKVLLCLAVSACDPNAYTANGAWWDISRYSTILIYIDPRFDAVTRTKIITDVIRSWNAYTQECGFSLQYKSTDIEHAWHAIVIRMDLDLPSADDILGRTLWKTVANRRTGKIDFWGNNNLYILVGPPEKYVREEVDFYTVLRHEMGHALGLGHSPCPDCLVDSTLPPNTVRYISDAEQNGLYCIYGSLFGDRVRPGGGFEAHITPIDRRHVTISMLIGSCNGMGTGGADSAKVKMNFHRGKDIVWQTIDSFPYPSRCYWDSVVVELPPWDDNESGWRVLRSYVYFPDTTIISESDTFYFGFLEVEDSTGSFSMEDSIPLDIATLPEGLKITNSGRFPVSVDIYNSCGRAIRSKMKIEPSEGVLLEDMTQGVYIIRVTVDGGDKRVYIRKIIAF